jgi:uncharacterized repeat protein (TIGR03809 family)
MEQSGAGNARERAAWNGSEYARRWLALAERRRDDIIELYRSGRWRHCYTEAEFLAVMRAAKADVEAWAALAGLPPETLAKAG